MSEKRLSFLSESTQRIHKEYLNTQRLRYSILLKSEPQLIGLEAVDIQRSRGIKRDIKEEAVGQLSEIKAHELYFSSFGECGGRSDTIRARYGSENSFLYSTMRSALSFGEGYCFIVKSQNGIFALNTKSAKTVYLDSRISPVLCIDLYEHAYFCDYGFKREEYLNAALSHLDLKRLQ